MELDAAFVGRGGHGAAQRIDLLDQVTLADAPIEGLQLICPGSDVVVSSGPAAHARRRQGGLGPA